MTDTPTTNADALRSIVAAMWVEYNHDQQCDYRRINRLIEDAAEVLRREMSMDDLDAMGEAHQDDPIWAALDAERGARKEQPA